MSGMTEVWVAYYGDKSGIYFFASELEALRYANSMGGSMTVVRVDCVDSGTELASIR